MNEYAPIDIKDTYTNLPTKSPIESNNSRSSVVYFYNDTVNPDATDKIPPLAALVDTINTKTAVFGDIIINQDGTPNLNATSSAKDNMPQTVVMPNSLNDDPLTKFFIGSMTVVGLYMLYRLMIKNQR